jgi:hypothetical protein
VTKGRLEGDSGVITTQGANGPKNMVEYQKATGPGGVRARRFTFLNGNAFGGATVYAGPNNQARFPLAPPAVAGGTGASYTWNNVDPTKMALDDRGTASTIYFTYGGECEQDAER